MTSPLLPLLLILFLNIGTHAQCPPQTQQVLRNNQIITCNPQDRCVCELVKPGAFCQYSSSQAQYICCSTASTLCPNGSPFLTATGQYASCTLNSHCSSGSICNQNICCINSVASECKSSCLAGQVLVNEVCVSIVPLGGFCQSTIQCEEDSQCITGKCQCPSSHNVVNGVCKKLQSCDIGTIAVNGQCLSLSAPGFQCVSNNQCIDNSLCINSVCTCRNEMNNVNGYCISHTGGPCQRTQIFLNGECLIYSIVGGSCVADAQCVGGSSCQNFICACKTGTIALYGYCISQTTTNCNSNEVFINNQCYPTVQIGNSCSFNQQCLGNSECSGGRCQCPSGSSVSNGQCTNACGNNMVLINNQCYPTVQIGNSCSFNQQCLGNSECSGGRCQCPSGSSVSNGQCTNACGNNMVLINNQCYPTVQIGNSCSFNQQCLGNSECIGGRCQCPSGSSLSNGQCFNPCGNNMVLINNQCYPTVQIGNSCSFNQQCLGNSECSGGRCQCPSGSSVSNGQCTNSCGNNMVLINNQCYPTVQIGNSCSFNQQCLGNSECSSGRCQCSPGSSISNGQCFNPCGNNMVLINNQCYPTVQIGNSCSFNQQCLGNSECSGGRCQCPSGSSVSNGQCTNSCGNNMVLINNQCYPTVQIGNSCSFNQQCLGNSECSGGRCQCSPGSSVSNGQCFNPCGNNMVLINNQCYPTVQIGNSCSFTQQCLGNSECSGGRCQCPSGSSVSNGQCTNACGNNMVLINNQCYPTVQIGNSCSFTQQCLGNSECSGGRCQCSPGSSVSNGQCFNPCGNNMVLINNQCYPTVQIGNSCSFTQQCLGNSECIGGRCQCPSGSSVSNGQCTNACGNNMVLINNQCYPTVQIGSSCSFTQQCLGNSECSGGRCQCSPGSSVSNGQCFNPCGNNMVLINNQCYPTVQIGNSCSFNQQCLGNSECSGGRCQCPSGSSVSNGQCTNSCGNNMVLINNQCYPTVQIGNSCSFTQQCLGNSECSGGRCQCSPGSSVSNGQCFNPCGNNMVLINNQCYPTVQIGNSCSFNQQCLGNSECSGGRCQCPSGSSVSNGQCTNSCGNNMVLINNQCYPTVQIGNSCSFNQQCLGNSECIGGRCQCPGGSDIVNGVCSIPNCKSYQVSLNGQCYDKVSIGQSCVNSLQCEVQGVAACSTTCKCSTGTYNGTHCLTSISSCSPGNVNVNNKCLSQVQLGQFCQYTAQCLGFGICSNTFCTCPTNFTNINGTCRLNNTSTCGNNQIQVNGNCYNLAKPGQFCSVTAQCTGSSTCEANSCRCPTNMRDYGDGICRT